MQSHHIERVKMGNLISTSSSKSKHHITDVDRAILSLKTQRKKLEDQSKLVRHDALDIHPKRLIGHLCSKAHAEVMCYCMWIGPVHRVQQVLGTDSRRCHYS